jgi:hypothetical protein
VTVLNTSSSRTLIGNGVNDTFATGFKFLDSAHLTVEVDDVVKTEGVDYDVTGEGNEDGGNVVFRAGKIPANAATVYIERNTPALQETDLPDQGEFEASDVEGMSDKLTLQVQELVRRVAVLEAVGNLYLSSPDFAAAIRLVDHDFATDAGSVEATFPFDVACSQGSTMTSAWITFLQNLDDPTEVFDELPALQWGPAAGNFITIKRIAGLKPGTNYRFRLLAVA